MSDKLKVADSIAEQLEVMGLWRRAASRWLDVMLQCSTDEQRDWVRQRRCYCISRLTTGSSDQNDEKIGT